MSDSLKEFQRKIKSRKFAIENSWKADALLQDEVPSPSNGQEPSQDPYDWESRCALLNENLLEADANKFTDGYFPIFSRKKYLGRFIVFWKRAIRKLLKIFWGWYIFPIFERTNYFHAKMVNAVSLERELLVQLQQQLLSEKRDRENEYSSIRAGVADLSMRMQQLANSQAELHDAIRGVADLSMRVQQLANSQVELHDAIRGVQDDTEELKHTAEERLRQLDKQLTDLNEMVADLNKDYRRNDLDMSDEFYHDFEEAFRGSQEDIKNRLQIYVPIIKEHLPNWKNGTFVDVGSGRGEWLDVLRENGAVDCVGVDLNQTQNKICEERGHRTVCMDCVQYLQEQPDESVNLVTGFQIIEHLPLPVFVQMLKECKRALKPGGMILFETPNPDNLSVGADTFYLDPSHKRPLVPHLTRFLVQYCGFDGVQVIGANAHNAFIKFPDNQIGEENEKLVQHLNDISWKLFGPQDYAIFAVKG